MWESFGRIFEYLMVAAVLVGLWAWQRRASRRARPDTRSAFETRVGTPQAGQPPAAPPLTAECRWGADHFRNDPSETRWVCAACNAETYLPQGGPAPAACLRSATIPTRKTN
jgi:hypothetical protein